MNNTCFIVDDESGAVELLKDYVDRTPGLKLIGTTTNPLEALDPLTGKNAPDITFIDIDMRQLSGLELAGMVNLYTKVIFTTAFSQFALQAFDKEAFDYLLKPINYERFLKCINRFRRETIVSNLWDTAQGVDFFNIKSEVKGRMVRILLHDIRYIEAASNYIIIHTTDEKHMTYLKIRDMERGLPAKSFVRIHRSFIANINCVKVIERGRVILQDGTILTLGDQYKTDFLAMMDEHLISGNNAS